MKQPVDIVVPWVDGSDPVWRKEKAVSVKKYCPEDKSNADIRFESWDNLKYWFRAIEAFMPWVRQIVFVTWGHIPDFLNCRHPRLKIIKHVDYIPSEYLPTYNSNTIELNYHRVEQLSENFIIFNDDMIPLQPIEEEYYFKNNTVCDEAVENIIAAAEFGAIGTMARYTQVNNMIVINRHFQKRKVQMENWKKWYCKDYGELLERTKSLNYWYSFPGFHDPHMPSALKKSTLQKIWDIEGTTLKRSSMNHFRAYSDVTQYLIRYWQLCEGDFYPRRTLGKMFQVNMENYKEAAEGIAAQKWQMISLNEDCTSREFEIIKKEINRALAAILPEKSTFEK